MLLNLFIGIVRYIIYDKVIIRKRLLIGLRFLLYIYGWFFFFVCI